MRVLLLAALAFGTVAAAEPASAQTYDPSSPVCLHVYGPVTYYECGYTSLPQCAASASGRSAQCVINPYYGNVYGNVYANAYADPVPRRYRRYRQVY